MKKLHRNLFFKLLTSILLVILVPFIIFNVISYQSSYRAVLKQMIDLNKELLSNGERSIESFFYSIEQAPMVVYRNTSSRAVLLDNEKYDDNEYYLVQQLMKDIIATDQSIIGTRIYNYHSRPAEYVLSDFYYRLTDDILPIDDHWHVIKARDGYRTLVYETDLKDEPYSRPLCQVAVFSRMDTVREIAERMKGQQDDSTVMIYINQMEEPVYTTSTIEYLEMDTEAMLASDSVDGVLNHVRGKLFCVTETYKDKEIVLVKFMSDSAISASAVYTLRVTILVQLCLMIFIVLFVILIYKMVVSPVNRIIKNMEQVSQGEYNYEAGPDTGDELWILERKYQMMLENIDTLVNKDYRNALEISKTRLKMLQAQINPHFLYNMLQSISTNALKQGAEDVSEQLVQLGAIFKYNMDTRHEQTTIGEELEHVERYMSLQNDRYREKIQLEIICPPEAFDLPIPKMVFQPLIENSLKHGIEREQGNGLIGIEIEKTDRLVIRISDNGKGFTAEKIEAIRAAYDNYEASASLNEGIGIINVLARMRIYSGADFEWQIESRPYEKTVITFVIYGEEQDEDFDN